MIVIEVTSKSIDAKIRRAIEQRIFAELCKRDVREDELLLYASGTDSDDIFAAVSSGVHEVVKSGETREFSVEVVRKGN